MERTKHFEVDCPLFGRDIGKHNLAEFFNKLKVINVSYLKPRMNKLICLPSLHKEKENNFHRGFELVKGKSHSISSAIRKHYYAIHWKGQKRHLLFKEHNSLFLDGFEAGGKLGQKQQGLAIADSFWCKWKEWPTSCLGVPLGGKPRSCSFWDPVTQRIKIKLVPWRRGFISLGGRIVSLRQPLPIRLYIYIYILFLINKKIFY